MERRLPVGISGNNFGLGGMAFQHVFQVGGCNASFANFVLFCGIGNKMGKIVNAQFFNRQAFDNGFDHIVQTLILGRLTQGNPAIGQNGGQGKTPKNLAVQVLRQQAGKIHLAAHQGFAHGAGNKERQREAGQQDKEQRKPGKSARV